MAPPPSSLQPAPSIDSETLLAHAGERGVLRFITCGSVDDGKSTLIGRMLHDSRRILDDQLRALARDSRKHGAAGEDIDFALLLDGLEAEREQGITIDVAYRHFATEKRKFIVADTPGHEQYTRNMATGASTADAAVILADARKGILTQTRRHTFIAHLLGVRHIVLAVNKMDLVEFSRDRFAEIAQEYRDLAATLSFATIEAIPVSARFGDNVTTPSASMPWYSGSTLLAYLESIETKDGRSALPFRMAVQWVNRPHADFRGFAGTIASGAIRRGDPVVVTRSGRAGAIKQILTADGELESAQAGDAITLTLSEEIDIARGDVLAPPEARPESTSQFAAHVIWMAEDALKPGRPYLLKIGAQTTNATITLLKHKIDINTLSERPGKTLTLNEIGFCNLETAQAIALDAYVQNRETGGFILIDRFTNATVGAGMIAYSLRRASNIHHQHMDVDQAARSALKGHRAAILWFTGLSAAGKSTIANLVEKKLAAMGCHTYALDGDNVRHGLNRDLGFTDADRVENVRRVGEVAKLFVDAGLIVTCSFISPFRAERQLVRDLVRPEEFIEIFVDAPLDVCIARDPKGLYKKAKAGALRNFTGFDSPYEPPAQAELRLESAAEPADILADKVIAYLRETGRLGGP